MICPKCGGLMVRESFFGGGTCFEMARCINCGLIIEEPVVQNRALDQPSTKGKKTS